MIGLLNAYHFDTTPGSYQEKYEPIFLDYLKKILPDHEIKTYQVAQNEFPKSTNECEGWIVSGSPASAYDNDEWINRLMEFIQDCHKAKTKLVGICFGHQIIAQALGGKVENSKKGWGIGVRDFKIDQTTTWMTPELNKNCALLFSHQDQVMKLPEGATLLGGDDFCRIQMYSIGNHIFSLQGHPEFTREYAKERYDTRIEKLGEDCYTKGVASLNNKTDELIVGKWIQHFFNQN